MISIAARRASSDRTTLVRSLASATRVAAVTTVWKRFRIAARLRHPEEADARQQALADEAVRAAAFASEKL